jgi:predicted phosphoribosyltransferase
MRHFADRHDAGARLARELESYAERPDVIVLGLPRGGVVVGYEIATRLRLPLDVFVVRKLGVPGHSELAMGAIASGGVLVLDRSITSRLGISSDAIEHVTAAERTELRRREQLFRGDRPPLEVRTKTVLIVDDGLATGATMTAAVEGLRLRHPSKIVVAVPVASPEVCEAFRSLVDEMVCLMTPTPLHAVGLWYVDFSQTTDAEVRQLLAAAARAPQPRDISVWF